MTPVRTVLVGVAGTLLALVPGPALADHDSHSDAAGDVVSFPLSDGGSPAESPAAGRSLGDVIGSSVAHRRRVVAMRLQYRDLEPAGAAAGHLFLLRTPTLARLVTVLTGPGSWGGRVTVENAAGHQVRCHVTESIDYDANTVTVVVPRTCLGNPRWVRVGMVGLTFDRLDTVFADDARATGTVGRDPVLGPRVRR